LFEVPLSGEHPIRDPGELVCPRRPLVDIAVSAVKALPRLASRWGIPLASAAFAVFLASMASAKGNKPQQRHAAPAATPASTRHGAPRTQRPAAATHAQPGHGAPAGHAATSRTRHGAQHGHGGAWSSQDLFWHRDRWGPQGSNVVEGSLPAPVPGGMCPADMAMIESRYCVDRYEASLVAVEPNGNETLWSPFSALQEGVRVRARSVSGVYPQAYISGAQAQQACAGSGKRLCNPSEWRQACGGPHKTVWTYGATHVAGACNDHGRSPMLHFYPQVAESWNLVGMPEMNDERLNQWDGTLMKTGESPDCTNEYGVYDMVGNLHEWTADPNGTFQGGWYLDTHENGDGCGYRTTAHEFTYHDYSTGFRCCADVVPPGAAPGANAPLTGAPASPAAATTATAPSAPAADPPAPRPVDDTLAPQAVPTATQHAPNPRHPEDDDPYSL
jgi:hypothetical protein